jgi:dGTPase
MLKTRAIMQAEEAATMAPYAQKVAESAGRAHEEPPHPYRTHYQRDRARIIHSRAFRRLEYKTQVFLNGTGDHLRTRLTHTIEVASVSRTVARALGVNEDLAEAIALAHDLGHAPFGHSGEEQLDRLMREWGGFEHNTQSLRVVELIESTYPGFRGLNLSYEVLEGLRKHDGGYHRPAFDGRESEDFTCPSIEAQIANIADEITYYSHDLDDGLSHQLILEKQLEDVEIWRKCAEFVRVHFPDLRGVSFRSYVIRTLIDHEVADLIATSNARIEDSGVRSADGVRRQKRPLIGYSDALRKANQQLRKFLYQNLYYHPAVSGPNQKGCAMIEAVFRRYMAEPERVGERTAERLASEGMQRTICDYISGMTDRYLIAEYETLQGGTSSMLRSPRRGLPGL